LSIDGEVEVVMWLTPPCPSSILCIQACTFLQTCVLLHLLISKITRRRFFFLS